MRLDDWFDHARRDAARRGLPALEPLLHMLLDATRALRAADWARDDDAGAHRDAGDDAAATGEAGDDAGAHGEPGDDVAVPGEPGVTGSAGNGAPSGARSFGRSAGLPEEGAPPPGPTTPARDESR